MVVQWVRSYGNCTTLEIPPILKHGQSGLYGYAWRGPGSPYVCGQWPNRHGRLQVFIIITYFILLQPWTIFILSFFLLLLLSGGAVKNWWSSSGTLNMTWLFWQRYNEATKFGYPFLFSDFLPWKERTPCVFFSFCPLLFSFHRAALRNDEVTIIISRTGWCGRAFLPLLTFHFYSSFFSFLFRYVWGKHLFHLCLHFSPTRLWKRVVVIFHCFFAFAAGRCLLRASHHCVDVPAWNWVWFSWAFKHFSLWFDACRCAHSFPFLKDIVGLWLFSWHFRCCCYCCFFVFFLYLHLNVSVLFCAFPMVTWAQLLICEQLCTNSAQICFSV